MANRNIPYKLKPAILGDKISDDSDVAITGSAVGVLAGATDVSTALRRIDGTGVGAAIFRFSGNYAAQNSNINEWFGGRQLTRLRCTSNGGSVPVTFTLPGNLALGSAFDQLVADGLPETIRFIIEYTGTTTFLNVIPRTGGPNISGVSSITVRPGVAAGVEVTRDGGVISNYVFTSIGVIGDTSNNAFDSIKIINSATQTWDASIGGTLPSTGVVKGNAYEIVNVPVGADTVLGEVMQNEDYAVWSGETFTSWTATPHQWFVLPAHDARRISALERNFLTGVLETPVSNRNAVIRGTNYADSASELRMKIYATEADYDPADLNTTGQIDSYTGGNITGRLAIRLTGTNASLAGVLPTLYVYSAGPEGNVRVFNLATDFTFEGDFGNESDYLAIEDYDYVAGTQLTVRFGTLQTRYNIPTLDVFEDNLSNSVQSKLNGREPWAAVADVLFSGASVSDIHVADRIAYQTGYSKGVDWRDMSEGTTINANRYIDDTLIISSNTAAFTIDGFGVLNQRLVFIQLQRNDANNGEGAMVELAPSTPFLRIGSYTNTGPTDPRPTNNNQIQINTTLNTAGASPNWVSLNDGSATIPTLGSGINYLILDIVTTAPNTFRVVPVFFNGTTYNQLNDVTFTTSGTVSGDEMGFSRSASQRGQVLRFSAINSPGYLFHSQLQALLQQHVNDKWNFGFARLITGSTRKEVSFSTALEVDDGKSNKIQVGTDLILTSPNGTEYRLSIDDTGALTTTVIP